MSRDVVYALSVLSGGIFFLGFVPYIRAILRGEAKPAKASWLIWASLDTVTLAGMYASNTVNGQIVAATCGSWIIVFLALKQGVSGWSRLDKACLAGAALGIALWIAFSSPLLAILVSMSVVFLGSFPTFKSVWDDPGRENLLTWSCFLTSCIFSLLAVPQWSLANAAQPVVFFATNSIVVLLLLVRRHQAALQSSK